MFKLPIEKIFDIFEKECFFFSSKQPFTVNVSKPKSWLNIKYKDFEFISTSGSSLTSSKILLAKSTFTFIFISLSSIIIGWKKFKNFNFDIDLIRYSEFLVKILFTLTN